MIEKFGEDSQIEDTETRLTPGLSETEIAILEM